ncbi:MAG: FG-GAP-like repeat-containing protein [Polaribacter sp.]
MNIKGEMVGKMKWNFMILICCMTFFYSPLIRSQEFFKHIETVTGFGNLRDNNGVAVADYDGDFDLDIFVVTVWKDDFGLEESKSRLYRNNGDGTYTDVTDGSGLENLLPVDEVDATYNNFRGFQGFKNGAFWGDYDNDGDPDIFFTHLSRVQLFNNQGDGTFIEVTTDAGINRDNGCENTGAVWFDYNNDSYLDLYVVDWSACTSNTLYKNNGDGTFTDVTSQTQIETSENLKGYVAFPYDFNNDGWMDLYLTNDFRKPNQLFINNNGVIFTEEASEYKIDALFNDMGLAIGDYNKDGNFDFITTTIANNSLFTGKADGTFEQNSSELGVKNTGWSWGAKFGDFDLDGDDDLIILNGFEDSGLKAQINLYFENLLETGTVGFSNENDQGIGELSISVDVIDFDYDFDGDLDLFVTNTDRNSFFYENSTISYTNQNTNGWFQLSLQGVASNRDAIGTKVTVTTDKDTFVRYYAGIGMLGQSLKPVHFGLKDATTITSLTIEWPSGNVDTYTDLDINSFGKAIEGISYENLNITPAQKVFGCTDPNSCNYNPDATVSDGSCIYAQVSTVINGPTVLPFFSQATYSYDLNQGSNVNWSVVGGDIVSGQGTDAITVQWHFEENSKVSLIVTETNCKSEEVELEVSLGLKDIAEDKSVARIWNEALLQAIRGDFARPTVHARNLFHTSIALYDAWAIYSDEALPYLIGNTVNGFTSSLAAFTAQEDIEASRLKAMSYAAYRLLSHRFKNSPGAASSQDKFDLLMNQMNYDIDFTDTDYISGNAAALGNYIAQVIIDFGNNDGSRELTNYDNAHYAPVNPPLAPELPGNPDLVYPNRWQSLSLDTYIDQSGNLIEGETIDFLNPEWGDVWPFAMNDSHKTTYERNGNTYYVYHDPLNPPELGSSENVLDEAYKKGFSQVAIWSSHLDPTDGVMWDISPKSIGKIESSAFPTNYSEYSNFYNYFLGGDIGTGHSVNPTTNQPYESQTVPRGDYTRVLAEFWADGPDSETPPGHWFTILNYVNDNENLVKKLEGKGEILSHLEWDVKAYFLLGGAMHDAAISAWSVKGWYDYIRPISAIRYMAGLGQSSDSNASSYHPNGIVLEPGYIELVTEDDPLADRHPEHIGKIKLKAWIGHNAIGNTETDQAGVDWILAENWWPYQRPSFVTPPFAGFVSGHSTYSRAAAELLTLLTGDAYFPGGMGEFVAKKNEFLVFEEGPSMDITLQWATYRDASDQCSLSRIWGGIHPPADDIPGRLIGEKVGVDAFNYGVEYFTKKTLSTTTNTLTKNQILYPNPVEASHTVYISNTDENDFFFLTDIRGRTIELKQNYNNAFVRTKIDVPEISTGVYILRNTKGLTWKLVIE